MHRIANGQDALKPDGLATNSNAAHFRVRHAQGLNGMLDGHSFAKRVFYPPVSLLSRQKIIQFAVKPEAAMFS